MTSATIDRPVRAAEMGHREAEEITQAIKNNFDSLGAMILQARDRKAYKALGYRAFETYCKTEFGKSVSQAYQLIEDVKAVAELEAEISKQYDEPVTLRIPSSHLRPLKQLPEMGDKLKAIEYAKKLATAEGKTPTKKHVEIAVFQVSGKRSDDFKSAIEGQGFTKGTQVEVTKSLRKDRGFVTKVDKLGKIYVELHTGGAVPIPYDINDLRILGDTEKPTTPASDHTVEKGDKVKIFAKGLEGIGEIYTWKMGKHASVLLTGESQPTIIPYAELELIKEQAITVQKVGKWKDFEWTVNGSNYYYFEQEDKIVCSSWPAGLSLNPYYAQGFDSPAEFMKQWEERFAPQLGKALTAGITDDIQLARLREENHQLREQLVEAESTIEAIVNMAHEQIQILPEVEEVAEFPVENAASTDSPLGAGQTTEFLAVNAASTDSPLGAEESWFPQEMTDRIASEREKLFDKIENFQTNKGKTKREKEQNAKKEIDGLRYSLSQLDKLENLRIGQTVYYKNDPIRHGEITGFAFTTGGMPHVFVRWESEDDSVVSTEIVSGILISPPGL